VECDNVKPIRTFLAFQRNILPPFYWLKTKVSRKVSNEASKQAATPAFSLLAQLLFDPENGGNMFLLYADKLLREYMVSYSRRHGYHHENLIFHKFHGVCQHTLSRREKG
jgi:hypothetical protein